MANHLAAVRAFIDANEHAAIERLKDFLRIPSVSTDPAHAADVAHAAEWMVRDLRTMGFNAESVKTAGHPMVLAHHPGTGGSGAPRVLYYGHYDVQPADPVELWESPPFEPQLVDGPHGKRIVARGAVDDKGQVMTFVEALRAWHHAAGGPPCPVTLMIEGEEESGSASLEPKARVHRMLDAKVEIGHITRTARQSPPRNQSRRRSDFVPDVRIEMRHSLLCPRNRNRLQNKFCAVGFRLFDKQSRSRMKQTRPRANPRSVRRHCFNSLNN